MSGLVKFFKNALVSPSSNETDSASAYHQSLLNNLQVTEENKDTASAKLPSDNSHEIITLGYSEWKERCNVIVSNYLTLRFDNETAKDEESPQNETSTECHREANSSTDEKDSATRQRSDDIQQDSELDTFPSTQPENMEPETQEPMSGFATPSPEKKRNIVVAIPHISLACHGATSVSETDMYTEKLSLDLCEVVKVYPMRSTRRFQSMFKKNLISSSLAKKNMESSTNDIIRFPPLQHHNEIGSTIVSDGPLFSLYKRVLSMEVLQLESSASKDFLGKQNNLFGTSKPHRRFMMYLYDDYATFMNNFLDSTREDDDVYLALNNIPGCCIAPFDTGNQTFLNLLERDLSPYAISFGGPSKAVLNKTNHRLSFEADSLEITVISANLEEISKAAAPIKGAQICPQKPIDATKAQEELYERLIQWKNKSSFVLPGPASNSPSFQTPPRKRTSEENNEENNKKQKVSIDPATTFTHNNMDSADGALLTNTFDAAVNHDATSYDDNTAIEGYDQLADLGDVLARHRQSPRKKRKGPPSTNVIAIVWSFSQPSRTKLNSWSMSVNLLDRSIMNNDVENDDTTVVRIIKLQIFRNKREDLPTHIAEAGNLLVIKGAGIQEYMGAMQLLGRSTTHIQVIVPNSNRSPYVEYDDGQWKSMKKLWNWGQIQFAVRTTLSDPKLKMQVHDLSLASQPAQQPRPDDISCGDITVMISAILPATVRQITGPLGYLRVWDGTGAPVSDPLPALLSTPETIQKLRTKGDPPSEALVKIKEATAILNNNIYHSLAPNLQETVVLTGRVVNVAVWELAHWEYLVNHCHIGMFIRLRNVEELDKSRADLDKHIALQIHAKTWLYPLPPQTLEVKYLLSDHENRMKRKEPYNPSSGLLPIDIPQLGETQQRSRSRPKKVAKKTALPEFSSKKRASHKTQSPSKLKPPPNEPITIDEGLRSSRINIGKTKNSPSTFVSHFYIQRISPHNTLKDLVAFHDKKKVYKYAFIVYVSDRKAPQKEAAACLCDTKAASVLLGGISAEEAYKYGKGDDAAFLAEKLNSQKRWKGWFATKRVKKETILICKQMEPI